MAAKISRNAARKINTYRDYFATELDQLSSQLDEFKANKEEFYRRWSQYNDFSKVERFLR